MRQVRFPPRRRGRAGKPQGPGGKKRTLSCGAVEQKKDSASGQAGAGRLPPLQNKVQVYTPTDIEVLLCLLLAPIILQLPTK